MRDQDYDAQAPKQSVSITLNSDVYAKAKRLGINTSRVAEESLAREYAARRGAARRCVPRCAEKWPRLELMLNELLNGEEHHRAGGGLEHAAELADGEIFALALGGVRGSPRRDGRQQ